MTLEEAKETIRQGARGPALVTAAHIVLAALEAAEQDKKDLLNDMHEREDRS